jgi:phosphatidylglycerophosphatase A
MRSDTTAVLPARLIAHGFGLGWLPWMPGTWASAATAVVAWPIAQHWGAAGLTAAFVVALVAGVWASDAVVFATGKQDPGSIVIDEVAGQFAALATLPPDTLHYVLGFIAFRAADIGKPWPASWADRTLKGGLGVMADDVIAAVYAAVAVHALDLVLT